MQIRPKHREDDDGCVAVMAATHRRDGYPRYWPSKPERFLSARQQTDAWVALLEDRVVGQVALHDADDDPTLPAAQRATGLPADRIAVLARLLVDPSVRGRGVGRALLGTATARAHATGRRPVLDVLQESSEVLGFYEAAGWTRLEPVSLDLTALGYGDVAPLRLWVYLGPAPPA